MPNFDDDIDGPYDADGTDTWGQGIGVYPVFADPVNVDSNVVTVVNGPGSAASFALGAAGEIAGAEAMFVHGAISLPAGTVSHTAAWVLKASGNVQISQAQTIAELFLDDGVKATLVVGDSYAEAFTGGTGDTGVAVDGAGRTLWLYTDQDDAWAQGAGTITCAKIGLYPNADITVGTLDGSQCTTGLRIYHSHVADDFGVTMIGNMTATAKTVEIMGFQDGRFTYLDMAAFNLSAADIPLGWNAADKGGGKLYLGTGTHTVTGTIAKSALSNAGENALAFEQCSIVCGIIDGTGVTVTSEGGHVHDGVLQDATITGTVHRFGATADSGNANVVDCLSPIGPGVALMAA